MLTRQTRAREAARAGYALAESIYVRGLYQVMKPDGTIYRVDAGTDNPSCNCPAKVTCKHVGLVEVSRLYWLALERKAAAAKPIRTRRRLFSQKHIEALRRFVPILAGRKAETAPASAPAPVSADEIARRARIAAMMLADFGPG